MVVDIHYHFCSAIDVLLVFLLPPHHVSLSRVSRQLSPQRQLRGDREQGQDRARLGRAERELRATPGWTHGRRHVRRCVTQRASGG